MSDQKDTYTIPSEMSHHLTPDQRVRLISDISMAIIYRQRQEIAERISDPFEAKIEWVRMAYGDDLAQRLRAFLERRKLEAEKANHETL
jgi:hypothetical protein